MGVQASDRPSDRDAQLSSATADAAPSVESKASSFATHTRPAVAAAASTDADSSRATAAACERVLESLGGSGSATGCTFAIVFSSRHHVAGAAKIASTVSRRLGTPAVIGVSAESVIGGEVEFEGVPGLSIFAARLPGVRVTPFSMHDLPLAYATSPMPTLASVAPNSGAMHEADEASDIQRLAAAAGIGAGFRATILFADPFTSSLSALLPALSAATRLGLPKPGTSAAADELLAARSGTVLGGIASASSRPSGNALFLGDRVMHTGLVGLTLSGNVRVDPVVSQGCRAFGETMIVTGARGNVIKRLGGRTALDALNHAIESLPAVDRDLLRKGVFVGRVVDEYKHRFGRGDYLIRGIVGVSKESGEIAINDALRVGQTIRFHLRDATTAHEDLELALDSQRLHGPPLGALVFTCNGRGSRMFDTPNHDSRVFARLFKGEVPGEAAAKPGTPIEPVNSGGAAGCAEHAAASPAIAGMHAAGEIGPVGGTAFVHGFTACAAVLRAEVPPVL